MLLLFFLTLAPLLVLLVTYGDRSRTTYMARVVALGALAFFWLLLGIVYFMADGVEPMLRQFPKEAVVIGWLAVFAGALWGMVWNVKQSSRDALKKIWDIAKTPSVELAVETAPAAMPAPSPKPKDMKETEAKLAGLVSGDRK